MAGLISQKCYYGIKAVYDLARHDAGQTVKIGAIAERQDIPIRFLEAILRQLKQGGFVDSRRGAAGGYFLAKKPSKIRLIDLIAFFEGDFSEMADRKTGGGEADHVLAEAWKEGRDALFGVLGRWTVTDMVKKAEADKSFITNFSI
jgi:Rrf2 family transcriptional regulator, cysteine metabolism repressor